MKVCEVLRLFQTRGQTDRSGKWEALKAAITSKFSDRTKTVSMDRAALRKELASTKAQYQQAAANIAVVKAEHMPAIQRRYGRTATEG